MFPWMRPDAVTLLMALDAAQMPRCRGAALVEVRGGRGTLRREYGLWGEAHQSPLRITLQGTPLLQAQMPGYSTTASLLAAGYGIENAECPELRQAADAMNGEFAGMEDAVLRLTPLLGLLPDGLYAVADVALYPTDGEGRFFWDAQNELTALQATAMQFLPETGYCISGSSSYLYPSQGTDRLDLDRVRHYGERFQAVETFPRAVAFHVSEYMSLLLDGHHKATAAFLQGRTVPCLTILPLDSVRPNAPGEPKRLTFSKLSVPLNRLPGRLSTELDRPRPFPLPERRRLEIAVQRLFTRVWPAAYREQARRYPLVLEVAEELDVGIQDTDWEAQLTACLAQLRPENAYKARVLLQSLFRRDGEAVKALALRCARTKGYPDLREAAFSLLSSLPNDWEVEQLFIEHLLEDRYPRSKLKQIADAYLEQATS